MHCYVTLIRQMYVMELWRVADFLFFFKKYYHFVYILWYVSYTDGGVEGPSGYTVGKHNSCAFSFFPSHTPYFFMHV